MEGQEPEVQQDRGAGMVDIQKLEETFAERMKAELKVFAQDQQQAQMRAQQQAQYDAQAAEQQRLAQEQAQKDAFGQVVDPYIRPVAQGLNFKIDDTRDYVQFYTENPDAVARREEIEKTFRQVASTGTARPREDVNAWLVGREKLAKDREEAAKAALQASTISAGAGQRDSNVSNKDPYEMTKDEMVAFLGRSSF
jgi:hypothetical protein